MRYLKLFESFKEEEIHKICKKYGIKNYTINDDGSIDVDDNVDLQDVRLTKIPLKFRNVSGYFTCSDNKLTSLEFCPKSVGRDFGCSNNKLTSLKGCPTNVSDSFYCQNNQIVSFEGPHHIGGGFQCIGNPIYYIWNLISPSYKWIDMSYFNDLDIIQDDVIILDRLNEFLESIGMYTVTEVEGWKCV
jgi:hypothetical protein